MSEKTGARNFFAFIVGIALGAVVSSLFVARSGSETREAISDWLGEGREDIRSRSREAYAGTHGTDEPPPPRPKRAYVEMRGDDEPPTAATEMLDLS